MAAQRTAWLIAALMVAASLLAALARPGANSTLAARASLEATVPAHFGEWRELPVTQASIVDPQRDEMLGRAYSEVLARTYVNAAGYLIMLSVAYGSDQRSQEAHFPEVCYPAQGFLLEEAQDGFLTTGFGVVPVRRLFATLGARREPLTYWFVLGEVAVQGKLERRIADLRYGLSGRVPDGLLFRISSLDPDRARAYRMHEAFAAQLLEALSPANRVRLSGLPRAAP